MAFTKEEFEEIRHTMEETENDNTPFAIVSDDGIGVIGDPNMTEMKKGEYTIKFGFPNTEEWRKAIDPNEIFKETENYIGVEKTFTDVFISPRKHPTVLSAFTELYAFFNYISEDGEVRELTSDEIPEALQLLNEHSDAVYRAVGAVLGLDPDIAEMMLQTSASYALIKMIKDFPEIINEADFF